MLDLDVKTLIELKSTIYKLLDDIDKEIERIYTYEDDNFTIKMNCEIEINIDNVLEDFYIFFLNHHILIPIIKGFDPRLWYQTKEKNLVY